MAKHKVTRGKALSLTAAAAIITSALSSPALLKWGDLRGFTISLGLSTAILLPFYAVLYWHIRNN